MSQLRQIAARVLAMRTPAYVQISSVTPGAVDTPARHGAVRNHDADLALRPPTETQAANVVAGGQFCACGCGRELKRGSCLAVLRDWSRAFLRGHETDRDSASFGVGGGA